MKPYVASHLKGLNRKTVYNFISLHDTTSKAEISKLTGISSPTTIKIVDYLKKVDLVLEIGEGESNLGRKPLMLTLNRNKLFSAAFFFEGEFLSLGIVDILGKVVFKKLLRCKPDFCSVMKHISNGLIEEMFCEANLPIEKLLGIGIALPAIYNAEKQILVMAPLIGINKPMDISAHINSLAQKYHVDVMIENSANALCIGEFYSTDLYGSNDLIFISLGTGIGAGVILDGKLRAGQNYMSGEIGYFSFHMEEKSKIKKSGWLENQVNYRNLENEFGVTINTDFSVLPKNVLNSLLEYISSPMSLCINNIAMLLDCNKVRIGGVIGNMLGSLLIDSLNHRLEQICINKIIVESQINEDSGLIGITRKLTETKIDQILTEDIA